MLARILVKAKSPMNFILPFTILTNVRFSPRTVQRQSLGNLHNVLILLKTVDPRQIVSNITAISFCGVEIHRRRRENVALVLMTEFTCNKNTIVSSQKIR